MARMFTVTVLDDEVTTFLQDDVQLEEGVCTQGAVVTLDGHRLLTDRRGGTVEVTSGTGDNTGHRGQVTIEDRWTVGQTLIGRV